MKTVPRYLRASRAARPAAGETRSRNLGDLLTLAAGNSAGVVVTERSALTLTAAFACINVIATDTACLPIKQYKERKSGGRDEVTDTPEAQLLRWSPDGETTSMRSQQAWMGHTLGWGNGYMEVERDGAGRAVGLHLLDPSVTSARRRTRDNRLYYQSDGQTFLPDDVLHLAGLGFDGLSGYSPVKLARQAIGLGLAAETFGAALFGNGASPRGYLRTPKTLSTEAANRLRNRFENQYAGLFNAHRLAVLEEGLEWQKTSIDPEDAQFLATRQFQVIEICRIYRVPPHKVGDYSQSHLANIEASNLDYLVTTLTPWCEAMEQVLNMRLLTGAQRRNGFFFEHVLTAILRGDMKARAEYYTKLRDLGVFNRDKIAALENINPIGAAAGGETYLAPMNMVDLKEAGKNPKPVPAAEKPNAS